MKRFLWDLETSQSSIKSDLDSYWKVTLKLSFCVPRLKRPITERTDFQRKGPTAPSEDTRKNMIVNEVAAIVIK